MKLGYLIGIVLIIGCLIISLQNYEVVRIKLILWSIDTSPGLVMLTSIIVGIIIDALIRIRGK
ncbi:MAG: hypothetical protein QME40_03220 [bacterium]|nr:hypothetical protein [bacterium]